MVPETSSRRLARASPSAVSRSKATWRLSSPRHRVPARRPSPTVQPRRTRAAARARARRLQGWISAGSSGPSSWRRAWPMEASKTSPAVPCAPPSSSTRIGATVIGVDAFCPPSSRALAERPSLLPLFLGARQSARPLAASSTRLRTASRAPRWGRSPAVRRGAKETPPRVHGRWVGSPDPAAWSSRPEGRSVRGWGVCPPDPSPSDPGEPSSDCRSPLRRARRTPIQRGSKSLRRGCAHRPGASSGALLPPSQTESCGAGFGTRVTSSQKKRVCQKRCVDGLNDL